MRKRAFFLNRRWGKHRWTLLASVSVLALLAADRVPPAFAGSPPPLSPAALTQAAGIHQAQVAAAIAGSLANPATQKQVQLSTANLARAAQAFKAMQAAQGAATAASQLTQNGDPLSGIVQDPNTPSIGLGDLKKDLDNKIASMDQTAHNAVGTFTSFDLYTGETFDLIQQPTDTALFRIVAGRDPITGARTVAAPAKIFGTVNAPGTLYIQDSNGIIFGGTAQINIHSLIATSLDVGDSSMTLAQRNAFFLNNGIINPNGAPPSASFSYNPADTTVEGDVTVEAGAQINANLAPREVSPDAGGFVYLFAPNVTNNGTITTPSGETMMVAAQKIQLTPNAYPDGGIPAPSDTSQSASQSFRAVGVNTTEPIRASDPTSPLNNPPNPWRLDGKGQITAPGTVTNAGLINAERGVVILNGDNVTNSGVISANTSVTRNGQIFLDARIQLKLAGSSNIQALPAENGETIPLSAIDKFAPATIEMRGNVVDFDSGSLVEAPGATVNVTGTNNSGQVKVAYPFPVTFGDPRIYMAEDSTIDVSGLDGVTLPMSANLLTFKPFGNEFADSPLQRDGALRGQDLTIDTRDTGTLNGVSFVGTPLADVAAIAANIPLTTDQLLTTGGRVNLASNVSVNAGNVGDIVLRQGSTINVAGGYVQYEGGFVQTTNLITAEGRIVNIANANPLDTFVGIAGTFVEQHPHWGITKTFVNPLLAGGTFESGYVEGHDAGGIVLNGANYALDGTFEAGTVIGERQRALGKLPSSATANTVQADRTAMPSAGFFAISGQSNVALINTISPLPQIQQPDGTFRDFGTSDALPADRTQTALLSTDALSQAGFGSISVNFSGNLTVASDASLTVADGGAIGLTGGSADIEGKLTARSGNITVESTAHISGDLLGDPHTNFTPTDPTPPDLFNVTIGSNAVLDASGQWVNDAGAGPENLTGGAYINGGTITLKTDIRSGGCSTAACKTLTGDAASIVDLTGNIVVSAGSSLDVSSGGRITDRGVFQLDSKGRAAGNGGSVALQTYVGSWNTGAQGLLPPTTTLPASTVKFTESDGTAEGNAQAINNRIKAFGFAQGGKLTIQTPVIEIGNTAPGAFNLSANFFDGNAYSSYSLTSPAGSVIVAPDTTLTLRQRNFVADPDNLGALPTGAKLTGSAALDFLPDAIRSPVNLSLAATLPPLPFPASQSTSAPKPPEVALSVGQRAVINGDPGAEIDLAVAGRQVLPKTDPNNSLNIDIAAQTGVADIEGSILAHGGTINVGGGINSEVWLGAQSVLDVSGIAVTDTRQTFFQPGSVLPGGKVSINLQPDTTGSHSAIVAQEGATIDVSGSTGTFDILQGNGTIGLVAQKRPGTTVWSDAGSISLLASTILYDGTFKAHGGAPAANGGSLTIGRQDNGTLTIEASGNVVPDGLLPNTAIPDTSAGQVYFQADRLGGSGIASLTLTTSLISGDNSSGSTGRFSAGTILFDGSEGKIDIGSVDRRDATIHDLTSLILDTSVISLANSNSSGAVKPIPTLTPSFVPERFPAPDNPTLTPAACSADVCINANYVALRGAEATAQSLGAGTPTGTLRVQGNTIDIAAGGFTNFGQTPVLALSGIADAQFISTGDIRLRVPLANTPPTIDSATPPPSAGELITAGNLTLQAAQVYPVSDVDFTLKSVDPNGSITFLGNGPAASPPLSAGGQVTVDAAFIDQEGTLLAPLGTIRLGAKTVSDLSPGDPNKDQFVATQSVILGANSVTSVSLNGAIVPFGETQNGTNWSYDSTVGVPLGNPPAKNIVVSGTAVDQQAGATVDISGGGDIQASEFVRGTGGSHDVLAGNPNTYAIIPGYNPGAAPLDFDFISSLGDQVPLAGTSVFLSGGNGLPAGFYTLLPPHYATLPGAYRVTVVANSQDFRASQNVQLPDGTLQMAGSFANPMAGTQSARTIAFNVQSSAVWRQYSEIDQTSGNAFFGKQAPGSSGAPPRLPQDAGHVAFNAINALNLNGRILDLPAANGRGALVDIAAQDLQILAPGGTANAGYLGLDVATLDNLGAGSLLIGGVRSVDSNGETDIALIANSVELSNDSNSPLEAPEVILVAGTRDPNGPPDPLAVRGLQLDSGSAIAATGTVDNDAPTTIKLGDSAKKIRGQGSLLAVSNGGPLVIDRQNSNTAGLLDIAAGATISGGNALTMDTSGNLRIDKTATFAATNISIGSRSITFGDAKGNTGFEITDAAILTQLEQAKTLTLRTPGPVNFIGNQTIAMADAGAKLVLDTGSLVAQTPQATVSLGADTIEFDNSGTAAASASSGTAALKVSAGDIELGTGDKVLSGFGSASFTATQQIAVRGAGSLNEGTADVDLGFETPLFLVGAGAQQSIGTGGAVAFNALGSNAPVTTAEIGGTFTVNAASISDNTLIQATAGGVTLHATSGDIALGSNAEILANGFAQTFFDVTRIASGGEVQLFADAGNIEADTGAKIDISSATAQAGSAGTVILNAANGTITSGNGAAFDTGVIAGSVASDSGGTLKIDAKSLGTESLSIPSIFSNTIDIHVRNDNLSLANNVTAQNVTLTADAGMLSIDKSINASGAKGGTISLFGGQGVVLASTARLLATASDAAERGGDVVIGTEVGGILDLQGGLIDVSNTANAANGGTVRLRAPLLGNGVNDDVAINPVGTTIAGASSTAIEAFKVFTTDDGSGFNGIIDPVAQPGFFGSCTAQGVCSGTLLDFVENFSLSAAARQKFASLPQDVLHFQPGIELVNNDPTKNGGDITVANNWNLGSGIYDTATQTITKLFYRTDGGSPLGEAGTLTLRASRDLVINASVTDGFFQTQNRSDPTYISAVNQWITKATRGNVNTNVTNDGGLIVAGATAPNATVPSPNDPNKTIVVGPPPVAPYDPSANAISPVSTANDPAPIAGADLFPLIKNSDGSFSAIGSWSYRLVAGADTASANPLAVKPLSTFADNGNSPLAGHGNVVIDGHTTIPRGNIPVPTIVRTGTGSIDIAAGRDFILADKTAPGVVYTAGRNADPLPDPGFTLQTMNDPLNPGQTIQIPVANNPEGFLVPDVLSCNSVNSCQSYGVITAAAYPVDGGHLNVMVQQDILGLQEGNNRQQFFRPWLFDQGTALSDTEFGAFSPESAFASTRNPLTGKGTVFTPLQTSWWINFGSFDQGLMSVGGDVRIEAGRDISQLSVSLPTTARTSGGLNSIDAQGHLVAATAPVMHLDASGDLTVIAGRNILSGTYYEGSGAATITAGGSVSSNLVLNATKISTVLAVDSGNITLHARDAIDLAGLVSPTSLRNVADTTINSAAVHFISSYGPQSKVTLQSVSGDVVANSLAHDGSLLFGKDGSSVFPGINAYPASFEATSLLADVQVVDGLQLAPSNTGTLDLLAYGSLRTNAVSGGRTSNAIEQAESISTGPSVVEAAFNPLQPLAGLGSNSGAVLLHQGDPTPDRFYAVTGDIVSGPGAIGISPVAPGTAPLSWEVNKPAQVHAGQDIIDLPFFGQNLAADDVTQIIAGRDLFYTGAWQELNFLGQPRFQNDAGLSLAGPGFFDVEAGRNLGPFVTSTADILGANKITGQVANTNPNAKDPIGTGIVTFGNTVTVGNRFLLGVSGTDNSENQFAQSSNFALPQQGADIIALFGVGKNADYQAVIDTYVNPANAATARHNYLPELVLFLQTIGIQPVSESDAWTAFNILSINLQHAFVDEIFFKELNAAGSTTGNGQFADGYKIINTLFPAAFGYTDNGPNGAELVKQVATGNLDILHATIKTLQSATVPVVAADGTGLNVQSGGDIMLLGPGGNINVGTLAVESNGFLTNSSVGVLTLDNGAIDTFTDGSVLVNQSRVLTVQGGDIVMWSSNNDLNAGRGKKTDVDFKPLTVQFDPQDLQTINLNGLVSGAGIGAVQSTPDAPQATVSLIAPRGTVDAGDAGLRSSGNLNIKANRVLNAANIAAAGSVSGVPQVTEVNLGALESAGNSAGEATKTAEDTAQAATNRGAPLGPKKLPALITVEVLGFGDYDPESGQASPSDGTQPSPQQQQDRR